MAASRLYTSDSIQPRKLQIGRAGRAPIAAVGAESCEKLTDYRSQKPEE